MLILSINPSQGSWNPDQDRMLSHFNEEEKEEAR